MDAVGPVGAASRQGEVPLHTGKHGHGYIGAVIDMVDDIVIRQRHKIIAIGVVEADDLLRSTLAVGSGGMDVQRALEELAALAADAGVNAHMVALLLLCMHDTTL